MKLPALKISLALALGGISMAAQARPFADLNAIDQQVATFLRADPATATASFVPVDRRLKLSQCGMPLALQWHGSRRQSIQVQCPVGGGWKLYVRVMGAQAAPVAQPVIKRGDAITVTLSGTGFSVSQAGEALEQGAVGEWVRVRTSKDNEMRAQILRPGVVGMKMP